MKSVEVVEVSSGKREVRHIDEAQPGKVWLSCMLKKDGTPSKQFRPGGLVRWSAPYGDNGAQFKIGHFALVDEDREKRANNMRDEIARVRDILYHLEDELFALYAGPKANKS